LVGGYGSGGYTPSVESFDPVSETWTRATDLPSPLNYHTATFLPNGLVLVVGGLSSSNGIQPSAQLYDPGLGFSNSWRPRIPAARPPVSVGTSLTLAGSGFRGISEGSGGNFSQSSPGDHPVVQLRSIESGATVTLTGANWSSTSFTSTPVAGLAPGWALATMFVNGIPSASAILNITLPSPPPITLVAAQITADGLFSFAFTNTPQSLFTVLATTNPTLPPSGWEILGGVAETVPGQFQFTDAQATNFPQRYYRVRAP